MRRLVTFALLVLFTILSGENEKDYPSITVSGKAEIVKAADQAVIKFSVNDEGTTLRTAVEKAQTELVSITSELRKIGIDGKNINTSKFRTSNGYKFIFGLKSYKAVIDVVINIQEMSKVEDVILVLSTSTKTSLSDVKFKLSNETEVYKEAQLLAVREAKEKAEMIANELNVKIAGIYSVSKLQDDHSDNMLNFRGGRANEVTFSVDGLSVDGGVISDSFTFSAEIKISAEYEVSFKVENPEKKM